MIKNPRDLFLVRAKNNISSFIKLLNTSLDWTVLIYLLIPSIIIFVYHYYSLWVSQAIWAQKINFIHICLVLLIFVFSGRIRTYIQEADKLFLWQKKDWVNKMVFFSHVQSYVNMLLSTTLLFVLVFPILFLYLEVPLHIILLVFIITFLLKINISLTHRILILKHYSLFYYVYKIILLIIVGGLMLILWLKYLSSMIFLYSSVCILFITLFLLHIKSLYTFNFDKEVELENEIRHKYVQFLLSQSAYIGSPEFVTKKVRRSKKSSPYIFRNSQRIFKSSNSLYRYVEAYIKSLIRNKNWTNLYIQSVITGVIGIILVPYWFKWVLWMLMMIIFGYILKEYWYKFSNHPYLFLFTWKNFDTGKAIYKCLWITMLPGGVILSITLGLVLNSLTMMLVLSIVSIISMKYIARWVTNRIEIIETNENNL